jgi:CheY-like chemotaxis protein
MPLISDILVYIFLMFCQGYDLVPKKSTCYISDLLTTVAVIIDSYGRQVPIYFTVAKNISNAIITDNEWVWQMLLNFLTNACKHTDNGSIHVNLSLCTELPAGKKSCGEVVARSPIPGHTRQLQNRTSMRKREAIEEQYKKESQKQQKLLFDIVDTGVGVEKGRHDSLFEVFSQAQAGQSTGTGLGLFSVYSRCERLGGACGLISPNTSSGDGSTFWFAIPYVTAGSKLIKSTDFSRYRTGHVMCRECLPASSIVMGIEVSWKEKKDVVDDDANRNGSCGDLSSSFKLNEDDSLLQGEVGAPCNFPLTAFVVDDSQSIRKLLQRTLLGMGFTRVEMFENGKRALDAMKKEVVDMVFMDIQVG